MKSAIWSAWRISTFLTPFTRNSDCFTIGGQSTQSAFFTSIDVKNADCVLCPPIVKQSLLRVKGVKNVEIRQADQMADFMATVTYDDTVANEPALIAATTKAGYPSQVAS